MDPTSFSDACSQLGVNPETFKDLNPAQLGSAYRLRSLKVHPDKNPGDSSAKFVKLREAYEKLLGELSRCFTCFLCNTVWRWDKFPTHLDQAHGHKLCGYRGCEEHFGEEELITHRKEIHDFCFCEDCEVEVNADHWESHKNIHRCPFPSCEAQLAKGDLVEHIQETHEVVTCRECVEPRLLASYRPFFDHLLDQHRTHSCEFCQVMIAEESLESHVMSHDFKSCKSCVFDSGFKAHIHSNHGGVKTCPLCDDCSTGDDFLQHLRREHELPPNCRTCSSTHYSTEHIKADHKWAECRLCHGETFHAPDHFVTHHEWLPCPNCDDAFETKKDFHTHKDTHVFTTCAVGDCDMKIVQERYYDHLRDLHHRRNCPFCNEQQLSQPMTERELRLHVEEEHRASRPCRVSTCERLQTESGLPFHLREEHYWEFCTLCTRAFPSSVGLEEHNKAVHDRASDRYRSNRGGFCTMEECHGKHFKDLRGHQRKAHHHSLVQKKASQAGLMPCLGEGAPHRRSHRYRCKKCIAFKSRNSQTGV